MTNDTLTAAQGHSASLPSAEALALSPGQTQAYGLLTSAISASPLVLLEGGAGVGKSTLVERLLIEQGGKRLDLRDLYSLTANSAHAGLDVGLLRLLENALERHDLVVFEDFDLVGYILQSPIGYVRSEYWGTAFRTLLDRARAQGKAIVLTGVSFSGEWSPETPLSVMLSDRAQFVGVQPLDQADYAFHLGRALGAERVAKVDVRRLHEHAPRLNAHQLQILANFMVQADRYDAGFCQGIVDHRIASANIDTDDVANISFADLKGFENIAHQLATYVTNPLKSDPRFFGMGLRPKRGVLLYGPPGTGKTSVGRALARQMEGRFFLIDGTVVTDPSDQFYWTVQWVFSQAKRAAPSVVFIDDADVLFQSDRGTGLSRYLLTMLDGLESETAGKVAVILTAMNPNHLPPALLRSGRVELWLETQPPSEAIRAEMTAGYLKGAPPAFGDYDPAHAAALTEGFNAADMRRLVMDVKALYARDLLNDCPPVATASYFEAAVADINRARELLSLASSGKLKFG